MHKKYKKNSILPSLSQNCQELKTQKNALLGKKRKKSKITKSKNILEFKGYDEFNENQEILNEFFSKYLCSILEFYTKDKECTKILDFTKYLNVKANFLYKDENIDSKNLLDFLLKKFKTGTFSFTYYHLILKRNK